jgi:hypothetical protein
VVAFLEMSNNNKLSLQAIKKRPWRQNDMTQVLPTYEIFSF